MVDVAFDDFLDSDDDDFFLEASNQLLDNDFELESAVTKTENVVQNLSEVDTSNCFESIVPSEDKREIFDINPKSKLCENASDTAILPFSNNHYDSNKSINESEENDSGVTLDSSAVTNKTKVLNNSQNQYENSNKNETSATSSSSDCNNSTVNLNLISPTNSSYINSRFTPGFTPKAKKRKILGTAGFLEFFDGSKEASPSSSDKISIDIEFQNLVSSQYTPEHLSLPSWQKLQTTVSSCSNLHSTAKYYSIQRVLSESSKKKAPKHMVVPVLCVLLKKLGTKSPTVISVFMDDTGEINGKIDAEILIKYKEFFVEGTALILKNVTFLCDVLILKDQNLVSLYHPEGIEKHLQNLESVLETSEPLKPMTCECSKLPHVKKNALKTLNCDNPNRHASNCVTLSQNRPTSISYQSKTKYTTTSYKNNRTKSYKPEFVEPVQNRLKSVVNQNSFANRSGTSLITSQNSPISNTSTNNLSTRNDEFFKQLLDEDNCMDEFDELLGSLDEKSFIEGV